jgi:uncharacterized protein
MNQEFLKREHTGTFHDTLGRVFTLTEVVELTRKFIAAKPKRSYEIIVGTDSHPSEEVSFITAITVRRVGNGGIYFWTRSPKERISTLRDRIYREALHSITLAQELRGRLQEVLGDEFFWNDQIHIDVGEKGATRDFAAAVVGMVKGFGFDAVIKPDAFGAYAVADRHT